MSALHIHAPAVTEMRVTAGRCPDCERRSRFVGFFQDWYGWQSTCLRCGRQWDDGEWLPLAFMRGVRRHNVDRAKARWRKLRDSRAAALPETPKEAQPEGRASGDAEGGNRQETAA